MILPNESDRVQTITPAEQAAVAEENGQEKNGAYAWPTPPAEAPAPADDAGNGDKPAPTIADLITNRLEQLQPGLRPIEIGAFVDDLVTLLATIDLLTPTGLDELARDINEKLDARGYRTYTLPQWRVKAKMAQQAMARQSRDQVVPAAARFIALSKTPAENGAGPRCGIVDTSTGTLLTNFELEITEDRRVEDDVEPRTEFNGDLRLGDRVLDFTLASDRYANNDSLRASVYARLGSGAQMFCKPDVVRNAVAELSTNRKTTTTTTNFGWNAEGNAYLVPSGRITAAGFESATDDTQLRVDLRECPQAGYLDMRPLPGEELLRVKRHVIEDLLALHTRKVSHTLLGGAVAAVLRRWSGSSQRFALWLRGDTGSGKTTMGKLFMNFLRRLPRR